MKPSKSKCQFVMTHFYKGTIGLYTINRIDMLSAHGALGRVKPNPLSCTK